MRLAVGAFPVLGDILVSKYDTFKISRVAHRDVLSRFKRFERLLGHLPERDNRGIALQVMKAVCTGPMRPPKAKTKSPKPSTGNPALERRNAASPIRKPPKAKTR